MGKSKKSARTKGNTRPSSSGHSAELLSTAGVPPPSPPHGFFGFQNFPRETLSAKSTPLSFPEDMDKGCDDQIIRIIMKKMLKRDAVTKLKAVQEFMDFCSEDCNDVKSILPYWPRLFNKLAVDSDKRVRELIHKANKLVVLKVKRDIAPYLKSFMGTWLITQCDPYAPAASAAQCAFSAAFPPSKQSEALMFCRSEIIKVIRDDLFFLNPDSFKEPNGLSEDECEGKYQFVLTCTLSGMKLFLSVLSQDNKMKIQDEVTDIVDEQLFWAFSRNDISQIRRAWYNLISTLCHDMPQVFCNTKSKLIVAAMTSLSESDPIVAPAIWECALQVTVTFEDWWHHINVYKVVLPHLWKFLKHGGMGNAVHVFPCLLPFLSRFPKEIIGTGKYFYKEFFSCIMESFSLCQLKVPSECNAIIKAFLECLQYTVDSVFCDPERDSSVVQQLITEQLVPLIKSSLTPGGSYVAASSFYPLLGQYLQYLEDQTLIERKLGKVAQYSNFLTVFWEDVFSELLNILNMEHTQHEEVLTTLAVFFHSLYQPSKYISEKQKKVQFEEGSMDYDFDETDAISTYTVPCQNTSASSKCSFLFECTVKICGNLCLKLEVNLEPCCIKLLTEILSAVSSSELFFELLTFLQIPVKGIASAPKVFFQEVVLRWAKRSRFDEISLDSIADIILCICSCVNKHSALDLLNICSKVECQKLFCSVVLKTLESTEKKKIFCNWFQTPVFGSVLKTMLRRLIKQLTIAKINIDTSQVAIYQKTVLKCMNEANSEEPRIPKKNIDAILDVCLALLSVPMHVANENLGVYTFIDLVCDICENLFPCSMENWKKLRTLDSLIFRLFVLSLDHKLNLSDKQQKRLCNVWQAYIGNLARGRIKRNGKGFLFMASGHLHNLLQVPLPEEVKVHVVQLTLDFLEEVEKASCDGFVEPYDSVLSLMVENIFPSFDEWEGLKKGLKLSTVPSVLKGKWLHPIVQEKCLPISPMILPQFIITAETVSAVLHTILSVVSQPDEALKNSLLKHFPHLFWSLCYVESMEYFKSQTGQEILVVRNLRKRCNELITFLQMCDVQKLISDFYDLTLSDGMTWAIPFEKLMEMASQHPDYNIMTYIPILTKKIDKSVVLNELIAMQVCLRNGPSELNTVFLDSIPVNFFNIEVSPPREPDYFGVLSAVCCCIEQLQIQKLPRSQERLLGFLQDLVTYRRFYGSDENEDLQFVIVFTALSSVLLRDIPDALSYDLWNSIFKVIVVWFKQCSKIGDKVLNNTSALIFVHQTCNLICIICHLFEKEEAREGKGCRALPVQAKWRQMFNDLISSDLVELYLQVAENVKNLNQSSDAIESLMVVLSQAVEYLNTEQIVRTLLPLLSEGATYIDCNDITDYIYKLLHKLASFLMTKSLSLQFGIHSILNRIVLQVPKILGSRNITGGDDDEDENSFKSFPLVEVLQCTNGIVETMLDEVKLGDFCVLEPYTNSYTYTVAYLLTWAELLEYLNASFSEKRSLYAHWLEDNQLLSSLLKNLIRLVSENPSTCFEQVPQPGTVKRYQCQCQCTFVSLPPMSSLDAPSHTQVEHVAYNLYYNTLRKVPALVRTWWNNLDKKTADIVEKLTSRNISGLLSMMEINAIHLGNVQFNNMTVKARPSSREVVATYALDDSAIELSIQLPANYPLGPIVVDSRRKLGVGQGQWRNWLLQLTSFLNYHNGSIIDALALWKKNLDKKFEGLEECMICFFVLHSSSYKLPTVSCSTCKKKFHSTCLYKWFNTSNNSTCPSCRNYF